MVLRLPFFLFLATLLSSYADFTADNPIKLPELSDEYKINCQSFRVAVEANNLQNWSTIPAHCKNSIKSYLNGEQYYFDIDGIADAAYDFAYSAKGKGDKQAWVFDVEETLLSNIKYLSSPEINYGTGPIDPKTYYEWLKNNTATTEPALKDLFKALQRFEFDTIIISEAPESLRADLTRLLNDANYYEWTELILKGETDNEKSALQFKSEKRAELVGRGYTIVANVGDQWSDLSGENAGTRTFKIPNPVYCIP